MSECSCGVGKNRLIYACSGTSDVGHIADLSSRKLSKEGFGKMTCLAAIGAHLSGFVESAKGADLNITIDGCPVACGKKNLEHIGVKPEAINLAELGFVKGKSPVTDKNIEKAVKVIKAKLKISKQERPVRTTGSCGCS